MARVRPDEDARTDPDQYGANSGCYDAIKAGT